MTKIGQLRLPSVFSSSFLSKEHDRADLLARIAAKDRAALAELYQRFQKPLYSYLFHLLGQAELAEDTFQEVMLIVWQKAHTYKGKSALECWIFGIAHHQACKTLRHHPKSIFLELDAALEIPDEALTPEANAVRKATGEEVHRALASLTFEHREVLELAFYQEFSCKEIAAIVGIPEGTVKSRLSYARRSLKVALLQNGWEV